MKKLLVLSALFTNLMTAQVIDSTAITPVHLREIPKYNLAIDLGITQPLGRYSAYAGAGLSIAAIYEGYKTKNWGASIALRYQSNQFIAREAQFTFTQPTKDYNHTSIAVGPVYSTTSNRFQLDIAPRLGGILLNRPDDGAQGTLVLEDILIPINLDRNKSTSRSFYGELTVRFNYYFRRSVQVYVAPTYTTTLGQPYFYNAFPTNENLNPANLILNVGVKIALGPKYTNGELRDDSF